VFVTFVINELIKGDVNDDDVRYVDGAEQVHVLGIRNV